MFKRNKKVTIVDCYTYRADVFNYFPMSPASEYVPEWFKTLPAPKWDSMLRGDRVSEQNNIKNCPVIMQYFKRGFVLPLWSDLEIEVGEKGTDHYQWQYSDCRSAITSHSNHQLPPNLLGDYIHLKLESPWMLKCEQGIDFLCTELEWSFNNIPSSMHLLKGVLDFRTNAATNVNMFIKREDKVQNILLKAGTPLLHYVPLVETKINMKTHLVTTEQYASVSDVNTQISADARHKQKIKRDFFKKPKKFKTLVDV